MVVAQSRDHLSYQWYCNANPLPYGTSRELLLQQVTPDQSGTYTCSISSPSGGSVISNPAQVLVCPLPQAIPPPIHQPHMPPTMGPVHMQMPYSEPQWVPPTQHSGGQPDLTAGYDTAMPPSFMAEQSFQAEHYQKTRNASPISPSEDRPIGEGVSLAKTSLELLAGVYLYQIIFRYESRPHYALLRQGCSTCGQPTLPSWATATEHSRGRHTGPSRDPPIC